MTDGDPQPLSPAKRRRLIALGLLRALGSTVLLVAVYFIAPFELMAAAPVIMLIVGLLVLTGVAMWEVRAITRSAHPRVRASQALAVTAPLYLLVFAASYFVLASSDPEAFSAQGLTRLDTLYFTVTIFATVGFGDISATSQATRLLVMVQMILNLLVLGAGIQVLLGAVQRGEKEQTSDAGGDGR